MSDQYRTTNQQGSESSRRTTECNHINLLDNLASNLGKCRTELIHAETEQQTGTQTRKGSLNKRTRGNSLDKQLGTANKFRVCSRIIMTSTGSKILKSLNYARQGNSPGM